MSNSLWLVDFAVGLSWVNYDVLYLSNGQVKFGGVHSNYRRIIINPAGQEFFLRLNNKDDDSWLVHASYSFLEETAVKLTFFAPWSFPHPNITWLHYWTSNERMFAPSLNINMRGTLQHTNV